MITKIISHRGRTSLKSQDNTIQAIQDAIDLKVDMVEFDIRRTKDLQIICFHDETINGHLLSELNYSEILEFNPEIPTLEQLLWIVKGKIEIDIELKEPGYENDIILMVLDYFDYNKFIMKSFHRSVVRKIKSIDKNIFTGLLIGEDYNWRIFLDILKESITVNGFYLDQADFISSPFKAYEMGLMARISRMQIPLQVWTVNDTRLLEVLIRRKIHSIVTDIPEKAIEIRESILNV